MTALVPAVGDFDFSDDVMAAFGADDSFYFARKHRKEGNRKGATYRPCSVSRMEALRPRP
mgnify:CR=1 FL=1